MDMVLHAGAYVPAQRECQQHEALHHRVVAHLARHRPVRLRWQQADGGLQHVQFGRQGAGDAHAERDHRPCRHQALLLEPVQAVDLPQVKQLELGRDAARAHACCHVVAPGRRVVIDTRSQVERAAAQRDDVGAGFDHRQPFRVAGTSAVVTGAEIDDGLAASIADTGKQVAVGADLVGGCAVVQAGMAMHDRRAGAPAGQRLVGDGLRRHRVVGRSGLGRATAGDRSADDERLQLHRVS